MIKGRRRDLPDWSWEAADAPLAGDYGKYPDGDWYCVTPDPEALPAGLAKHSVVEHEDGTITVSPSILATHWDGRAWHAYLERGMWRSV